jgi:hypothetical protein
MLRNTSAPPPRPAAVETAQMVQEGYETPVLTRLGSVSELTGGGSMGSRNDAIKFRKHLG